MTTDAEIDGKAYVHWKSWQETYEGLVDADYLQQMTLEKCLKIAKKWRENIFVAKDGEKVVGFVGYGAYRDTTLADTGEVYGIYVLKDYHDQKVGYRLMNAAVEALGAYSQIAVWVLAGNDRAIRFYQRYGFVFDGTKQEIIMGTTNTELRMIYRR
ncbi:MAG: GNAT family N-acetyltransferase [Clostridia bacterium]|nr:GNAT family N-acetyltransferase [Clostridia bacterium]